MWSSFLTQIQQRIDDAADLLGDEEGEEVEVEKTVARHAPAQPASELQGSSSSLQPPNPKEPQVPDVTTDGGDAQGWEEEDLDDLIPPTAAVTPPPAPPPPLTNEETTASSIPTASVTITDPVPGSAEVLVSSADVEGGHEETHVTEAESDAVADGSQATTAAATDAVTAPQVEEPSTPPTTAEQLPSPPNDVPEEHDSGSPSPPLDVAGADERSTAAGPTSSANEPEEPAEAGEPQDSEELEEPPKPGEPEEVKELEETKETEEAEEAEEPKDTKDAEEPLKDTHGVTVQGSSDAEGDTTAQQQKPAAPSVEAIVTSTATSTSPPPVPSTAKESSDVTQLLRFQQQLAEEMENVAGLQKENSFLRGRVSSLESELSSATARLIKASGSDEQISLLIEKLGKEKERHKAVASERSELEEHVQDLEEELEEYRVKEQGWIGGAEQQKQNENAAQQRIAQLERDLRSRDALAEDLGAKLRDTTHQNGVLQRQVQELKASYSTQLDMVRESNSDTVDHLSREVEQLRSSLQNLSTEYDTRTAELEREVQQSDMRAHQAETRFSDAEFGSVNALQDLRNELEDSQRSIANWKAEAQKTRSEYTELLDQYALLKRSRAAAESDLRERLAAESTTTAELRKTCQEWEARYQALQETLRAAQDESEEQRKVIMQLEAANQKLKLATADTLNRSQSEASVGSPAPTKGSSLETSLAGSPFASRPTGRGAAIGVPMNPFVNRERPVWNDSTDRKTRERLEQEVLRQSTEVEQLRQVAKENSEWKNKFLQLQTEHDLLLQLYGQLEDDVGALKRKAAATSLASGPEGPGAVSATPPQGVSSSPSN